MPSHIAASIPFSSYFLASKQREPDPERGDVTTSSNSAAGRNTEEGERAPLLPAAQRSEEHAATTSATPAGRQSLLRFFSLHGRPRPGAAVPPAEAERACDITYPELEKLINNIGTGKLSYWETVSCRLPALRKETRDTIKSASTRLAGIGTAYVIGQAVGLPTGFLFGSELGTTFTDYYKKGVDTVHNDERPLAQEFANKWAHLKALLKDPLKSCSSETKASVQRLENMLDFYAKDYTKSEKANTISAAHLDVVKPLMLRYAFMVATNLRPKNVSKWEPNPEVDRAYEERLADFDEPTRDAIRILEQKIRNNSDPELEAGSLVAQMFGGPGGIGKTSIIELLQARVGLPLVTFNLSSDTIEKLQGEQSEMQTHDNTTVDEKVGLLAARIVRSGVANPILFFDEAEELNEPKMCAFMKNLLQKHPFLKTPSLGKGTGVDLSRCTFIFAKNGHVDDDALAQRLPEITLPALGKEQKMRSAQVAINKEIARIKGATGNEAAETISARAQEWLDHIATEDTKRNSGGRVIQNVMRDFIILLEGKLAENPGLQLAREEIEKKIVDLYLPYPQEETVDQRLDADKKEPALHCIESLLPAYVNQQKEREALETLRKDIRQSQLRANDTSMLLLVAALTGAGTDKEANTITDTGHQATAIYLVGTLAKACKRAAAKPGNTTLALHKVLRGLMEALENNSVTDANCRNQLLDVMHNIINDLPADNSRRQKTMAALNAWLESDSALSGNAALKERVNRIIAPSLVKGKEKA